MREQHPKTIAILGGSGVVEQALALLVAGVGYETRVLEAPPTGLAEDLLGDVDLLLICPGLGTARREESLAFLRGAEERMGVPVLELSSTIQQGMPSDEVGLVPWPTGIDRLACEIEAAIDAEAHNTPGTGSAPSRSRCSRKK